MIQTQSWVIANGRNSVNHNEKQHDEQLLFTGIVYLNHKALTSRLFFLDVLFRK